jgi:UDP-glucose 4-epimerase
MKIIVTGGAGFIGSNVVDNYIEAGHEVVIVDNLSSGSTQNINPKAKFYLTDIRSDEMKKIFDIENPDVVNHHAAQKSVIKSVEDPLLDADINIKGLVNLLELCVKHNVKKVIFVSSGGALVGDAKVIPTDETYEPFMISPYAITKYTGEKYLNYYSKIHNLKYTVLRYANVYGPRQIADGECGVIPIFMNNLIEYKPSKLFAYSDMPKGTTRDYVYVSDIAKANIAALTKGDNEIINIGMEKELYIEDIYYEVEKVIGKTIPLIREKERTGDVKRSVLDCSKAKRLLNWEGSVGLNEGLKLTYDYIAKNQGVK